MTQYGKIKVLLQKLKLRLLTGLELNEFIGSKAHNFTIFSKGLAVGNYQM